jgi:hypothetical protein
LQEPIVQFAANAGALPQPFLKTRPHSSLKVSETNAVGAPKNGCNTRQQSSRNQAVS